MILNIQIILSLMVGSDALLLLLLKCLGRGGGGVARGGLLWFTATARTGAPYLGCTWRGWLHSNGLGGRGLRGGPVCRDGALGT